MPCGFSTYGIVPLSKDKLVLIPCQFQWEWQVTWVLCTIQEAHHSSLVLFWMIITHLGFNNDHYSTCASHCHYYYYCCWYQNQQQNRQPTDLKILTMTKTLINRAQEEMTKSAHHDWRYKKDQSDSCHYYYHHSIIL